MFEGPSEVVPSQEDNKENIAEKESIVSFEELEKRAFDKEFPRKKVLLIDGNVPYAKDVAYKFGDDETLSSGITPFGLARIAGYLDKYGVPCEIARLQDLEDPSKKEEFQRVIDEAEIVGMSALSPSVDEAFAFLAQVKKEHPEKMTIGGAQHFALDADWILRNKQNTGLDACCTGQGEIPMLAVALGVPLEKIGSIAYAKESADAIEIKVNQKFQRLTEQDDAISEIERPAPARELPAEWEPMIVPEFAKFFNRCGSTETGSGCNHPCTFCTNERMYGRCEATLDTAKAEIKTLFENKVPFLYFRNAMLNFTVEHLLEVVNFMKEQNDSHEQKMAWYAFMSVEDGEYKFKEMAESGCVMVAIGMEDVVGDRKKTGKGAGLDQATKFADAAREHVLVRTLLIMGLENHYQLSREELKQQTLEYMKAHPQATYRINLWTPIVGTQNFDDFKDYLYRDVRTDNGAFKEHDTMHGVIDPEKMYDKLGITEENRWVKNPNDWVELKNEIMEEYLRSSEHDAFLETLKGKSVNGRKNILYDIASEYKKITLAGLEK